MKISKQQLVETIISEIMKGVSAQVRTIIREEIDIERVRLRKQLLEEFRDHQGTALRPMPAPTPSSKRKTSIDTGDHAINSILESIRSDMEDAAPEMRFEPQQTVETVSHQMINEQRRTSTGELWKPPDGEGYDFDPLKMDPSQIDWSNMVDALDKKGNHLPG